MALQLTPADLAPFANIPQAKAEAMIEDTVARAKRLAPCLAASDLDADTAAAAKAILRDVILRWHEVGAGGTVQHQQTTGPYSESKTTDTTSMARSSRFRPSEIKELQDLCRDRTTGGAFSVNLAQPTRNPYYVTLEDGTVADLRYRPDLWLEYGAPPGVR